MAKILVYDGDCPMCWWISQRFVDLGLIREEFRRPFQAFDGERARAMGEAGIRNEMLVLDESSDELRAGIAGFLWLLEETRLGGLARLGRLAPVRAGLRVVYRTIAYNRRILAPPERGIVCECDPDPHRGFRTLFLLTISAFVVGAAAVCGLAIDRALGVGGGLHAVVAVVVLWGALVLVGRLTLPVSLFRLIGSAAVVLAIGLLAALPALALSLAVERTAAWLLLFVGAMSGLAFGLRSLVWRVPRLRDGAPEAAGSG